MNFCPTCGGIVDLTETVPGVVVNHAYYVCRRCKVCWKETSTIDEQIVCISPYEKEVLVEE